MKVMRGVMARVAHASGRAPMTACFTAALVTACDIPTDPPKLHTRWLVPAAVMTVAVADLLPSAVQIAGSSFRMNIPAASMTALTLSQTCGAACGVPQGQMIAKPALWDSSALTLVLPRDVVGATLSEGALEVVLTHGLSFDLLRPSGAAQAGTIEVTARTSSRTVGRLLIQEPFPSGATLRRTLPLLPGEVAGDVVVSVVLHSPAGDPIPSEWLQTNGPALSVTVTPQQVDAAEARVRVENRTVAVEQVPLDLSRIDDNMTRRVLGGTALLSIDNPFAVTGTFQLRLAGGGVDIRRAVQLAAGRSTSRIELTFEEIRVLLGRVVTMTLSGPITATDGETSVRPGQSIRISPSFELLLEF